MGLNVHLRSVSRDPPVRPIPRPLLRSRIGTTTGEFHASVIVLGLRPWGWPDVEPLWWTVTVNFVTFRFTASDKRQLQQHALPQPVLVCIKVLLILKYGISVGSTGRRRMTSRLNTMKKKNEDSKAVFPSLSEIASDTLSNLWPFLKLISNDVWGEINIYVYT